MTAHDPVQDLLLACCHADPQVDRLTDLLARKLDWGSAIRRALALGVAPLVHAALQRAGRTDQIPADAAARLAAAYYRQATVNASAHATLEDTLARMHDAGIAAMVLKGAALAEPLYGNLALRPMIDLDLMVPADAVGTANALLRERGYTPYEGWRTDAWYEATGHHHLAPLHAPDNSITIELHRHIVPNDAPFRIPVAPFWERAQPIQIGASHALTLAPADLIFHLTTHQTLAKDFVGAIRRMCDLAVVTARLQGEIDWGALIALVRQANAGRFVFYPLRWARTLVGARCPGAVLDALSAAVGGRGMADTILDRVARRTVCRPHNASDFIPAWLLNYWLRELLDTSGTAGIGTTVGVVYRHLTRSAERTAPGLGKLLPAYALLVHPFVAIVRAARHRWRRT